MSHPNPLHDPRDIQEYIEERELDSLYKQLTEAYHRALRNKAPKTYTQALEAIRSIDLSLTCPRCLESYGCHDEDGTCQNGIDLFKVFPALESEVYSHER